MSGSDISFVYFIASASGPIKIGKAINPMQRMKELQTSSPERLNLLGVLFGDIILEQKLHLEFKELRLTGEWFRREERLLQYISDHSIDYNDDLRRETRLLCEAAAVKRREQASVYKEDIRAREIIEKCVFEAELMAKFVQKEAVVTLIDGLFSAHLKFVTVARDLMVINQAINHKLMENRMYVWGTDEVYRDIRRIIDSTLGCSWQDSKMFLTSESLDEDYLKEKIAEHIRYDLSTTTKNKIERITNVATSKLVREYKEGRRGK